MQDIKKRELKIQAKRKSTPWRDFVKEIGSRVSFAFYPYRGEVSRYPMIGRISSLVSNDEYMYQYEDIIKKSGQTITGQPVIDQFSSLFAKFTFPVTYQFFGCENTKYGDVIHDSKNVYLSFFVTTESENVLYSLSVKQKSADILNSVLVVQNSQNVYSSSAVTNSYKIFFSKNISNCSDCRFSANLTGCKECLLCNNLENKQYCINNQHYTQAEYLAMKKELLDAKEKYNQYYQQMLLLPFENYNSENSIGSCIIQSGNIKNGHYLLNVKDSKNICLIASDKGAKNIYDSILGGSGEVYDLYGSIGCGMCNNLYCCVQCGTCSKMYYSMFCENSSYCIGCIGLKNKQFFIFNKEYSKEEWFELANELFKQMDADGSLGTFFPASMNPFYFNDTIAYVVDDSFTKDEVTQDGYLRRDDEIRTDIGGDSEIIKVGDLEKYQCFDGEGNRRIDPEILKKVIRDEKGNYYRIVKMEYDFLVKYALPLPELHWLERIKLGFKFK